MSIAIPQFLAGMILPTVVGGVPGTATQNGTVGATTTATGDAFAGLLANTTAGQNTTNPLAQLYAQVQQQTQTAPVAYHTLPAELVEGQVVTEPVAPVVATPDITTDTDTAPSLVTIMGQHFTPKEDAGQLEAITAPAAENDLILQAAGNTTNDKAILFPNVNKGLMLEDGIAANNTKPTTDTTNVVAVATVVEPTVITQAAQTVDTTAATDAITNATAQIQVQAYAPATNTVAVDAQAAATITPTVIKNTPQTTTEPQAQTTDALAEGLAQSGEASNASDATGTRTRGTAAQGGHFNHLDLAAKVAQHQAATKDMVFSADPNKDQTSDTLDTLSTSSNTPTQTLHEITRHADASAKQLVMKQDPLHNNAIDQVTFKIGQAFKNGSNKVTVQLNPGELGKVEVKIDVNPDGRTNIVIAVEKPETLQLLQKDSADLQRSLSQAGVQADSGSLNFSLQSGNDNGSNNSNASDRAAANSRYKSVSEQSEDNSRLVTAYLASNRGAGGIDIRV